MRKIIVIGGGIGGLTMTIALQQKGLDVHVYESGAELQAVGKGIWLPPNALLVLERLGISEAIAQRGVLLERIELRDKDDGVLLNHDLRQIKAKYGHTTVSIHRVELHRVLAEHIQPGTLHLGKHCTRFTQDNDGVTAQFEDETHAEGDVLIGADGIHSVIRKALFPNVRLRYAGQTCYRGIANMELPDFLAHTCWEVWGGEFRFGFSPIGHREVYWYAPVTAPAGSARSDRTLLEMLAEGYASFPSPIPEIIERTPAKEIIRTALYDFLPIKRWWQGRVVLIGDAAHAMTPNLGQGGAQAIEDTFVLADMLSNCRTIAEAFREYEHLRMLKVRRIVNTAWQFGKVAHVRRRWLQKLRNVAMKSVPDWLNRKRIEWLYVLNY